MTGPREAAPNPRVLVVDDEEDLREVLRLCLEGEGYEVQVASTGGEALELLARGAYDVLLTDIRMPGVDGFELVKVLCGSGHPPPAIFFMTGYRDIELPEGLGAGVHGILRKPFTMDELLQALANGGDRHG